MKLLLKNINLIAVFMLAISLTGCTEDVIILPKISAGFTYTLNEDTGTVVFINISENANSYTWDFGDDKPVLPTSTIKEVNPIKSYTTGTYTVALKVMNAAGAVAYFEDIIVINIPQPLALPITFDADNVTYTAAAFEGATYAVLENPAPGGTNNLDSMVASITNSGVAYEGIVFDLGVAVDLTNEKSIKMKFWSDTALSVLLKLEEDTAFSEVSANHTGTGWETLLFTFSGEDTYSKLVVFVDGLGTTAGTFYIDDIEQISLGDAPVITLNGAATISLTKGSEYTEQGATAIDTEDGDISDEITIAGDFVDTDTLGSYEVSYTVTDSDSNVTVVRRTIEVSLGDAPNITLIGEASIILIQGDAYTEQGATASDTEDGDITSAIVIAGDTVDTNSVGTYVVSYTITDSDGNMTGIERSVAVTAAGACDDDVAQSQEAVSLNLTMSSEVEVIEDGATFEIIDNPDFDNTINSSCKVAKVTKLGNQNWDNIQVDLGAKLDFNTNSGLKIKVWSGRSNTSVLVKLEEIGNPGNNKELAISTSITSGWEELTFPFTSGDSDKFNKMVIFFDLNGGNTDTYYFDDLMLYGSGSGTGGGGTGGAGGNSLGGGDGCSTTISCPAAPAGELLNNGDFEECDCDWQLISNNGTVSISSTISNGGSKSGQIQSATGANPALKQERFGVGSIQPNTTYIVTFDIIASTAFGEGGVFKAFIFSEGANGGNVGATQHVLTENTTSISTTSWESKSYTFRTPGNANQVVGGISFLAELVNTGASVNIDNVVVREQ
jgi:hypothetical protein